MDDIDDSFDDVLASMEMPETSAPARTQPKPVEIKEKTRVNNLHVIQVNPKQRGNPLLKSISSIPWEYNDQIIPDYVVGKSACVLFLSIRYHNLKPDYLHERLKEIGKNYELRVLLVHVDVKVS